MKKMDEIRHEMTVCPRCKAQCMLGHDVDRQVYCACCGNSFRADDIIEITEDQFKTLTNESKRHSKGGWIAFEKLSE